MSALLQAELGALILREIEVPDALITVTAVTPSKDLLYATVNISVLPSEKAAEALRLLHREARRFEHILVRKLNLKPIPHLAFELDRGPERAAGIEKALLEGNTSETE